MSHLSKMSIPIFLHHSLINFNASFWSKPCNKWISGLQSYEEFVNAKNNLKQSNLNTVFANISKIIWPTSDSFLLIVIMSHFMNPIYNWTNMHTRTNAHNWVWHATSHVLGVDFISWYNFAFKRSAWMQEVFNSIILGFTCRPVSYCNEKRHHHTGSSHHIVYRDLHSQNTLILLCQNLFIKIQNNFNRISIFLIIPNFEVGAYM